MAGGRPARAVELISDDSVDLLAPLGADAIAARVRDLHAAGIDLPIVVTTAAARGRRRAARDDRRRRRPARPRDAGDESGVTRYASV